MKNFKVVSFATNEKFYLNALNNLKQSCENNGLDCDFEIVKNLNHLNKSQVTLYKPTFIKKKLEENNCPILWIDSDALVLRKFSLPSPDGYDIGTVPNIFPNKRKKNPKTAFVIAFTPSENAFHFLKVWEHLCKPWIDIKIGDHYRFNWTRMILKKRFREISIQENLAYSIKNNVNKEKEAFIKSELSDSVYSRICKIFKLLKKINDKIKNYFYFIYKLPENKK